MHVVFGQIRRTFDRVAVFDERSRAYRVRRSQAVPRSVLWPCDTWLDQGEEGACVAFGLSHELAAGPCSSIVTNETARRLYYEIQRRDEYPGGEYPGARPRMAGTSLLSGLKELKRLGAYDGYEWGFGLDDLLLGLQSGPAMLGITMREGMMAPTRGGVVTATGERMGGHCMCVRGVWLEYRQFIVRNSWSKTWGRDGDCLISFTDMMTLLADRGETAFPVGRHVIDMTAILQARPASWWRRVWSWVRGRRGKK